MIATKREAQAPLLCSSSDEELNACARPEDVSGSFGGGLSEYRQPKNCLSGETRDEIDLSAANEDLNLSDPRIAILDHDYRCSETNYDLDGFWTPSSPSESITSPVSNTSRCSPPPVKSPNSTCSSGSNYDARQPGFIVHAHAQTRRSPARNKLNKPDFVADDCISIRRYPQKYEFNKLHLVETRGCQTQREVSQSKTSEFPGNLRNNIFTPFASKTKFKRFPVAMRMRRLPKSYWEEPSEAKHSSTDISATSSTVNSHTAVNFSTYTILPPLFSSGKNDFAAEEILGTRPVSPIEEKSKIGVGCPQSQCMTQTITKTCMTSQNSCSGQKNGGGSQITTVNAELLASLFDSVTKEKQQVGVCNQTPTSPVCGGVFSNILGAKKHSVMSTVMTSSVHNGKKQLTRKQLDKPGRRVPELKKGNDPLLIEATITESLLPSLTIETAAHKSVVRTSQNGFTSNSIHL